MHFLVAVRITHVIVNAEIEGVIANQCRSTGVAIPRIDVKSKMFENSGDCHGSVRTASQ